MARTRDVPDAAPSALGASIAEVYGGPLDGFVTRRDALVRSLRTEGRRDDAAEVKALRKPKALAWALDAGALADPDAFAELDAAVEEVGEAQDGGGDIRGAIARLRAAEESLVAAAEGASRDHDHPVDRTALASALRAVVGSTATMHALRAGRLVDTTPGADDGAGAAGGEEMWAVPTPSGPSSRSRSASGSSRRRAKGGRTGADAKDADAPPAAEAEAPRPDPKVLRAAQRAVAAAERTAAKAEAAAAKAESAADAADDAARAAEDEAAAARRRADTSADAAHRARGKADGRAAERDDASAELARARAALDELSPSDG